MFEEIVKWILMNLATVEYHKISWFIPVLANMWKYNVRAEAV
jgi:hypothetical protein